MRELGLKSLLVCALTLLFGAAYVAVGVEALSEASPPPNDNCFDAQAIGDVMNLAFDTTNATFDGPGHCVHSPNIWYRYTASCTGCAIVSLCGSDFDTKLAVYDGGVCPPTRESLFSCNDDFCGQQSEIIFPVIAGNEYLIEIGAYGYDNTGQGVISVTCLDQTSSPANDHWYNAQPIGEVDEPGLAFDTTCATLDGPGKGAFIRTPNIWYCYNSECTGWVTVGLCGSDFDTKLVVYGNNSCGLEPTNANVIAFDDDSCLPDDAQVMFWAWAGSKYLIEVGGHMSTFVGRGAITINCNEQSTYPWPPPFAPNDDCQNAMSIGNVTNLTFNTTTATFDGPGYYITSPNIWYWYTAPWTGEVTVSLCGSSYDTMLAVYNGRSCYPTWLDLIEYNDDSETCGEQGEQSELTFAATAGRRYLIEVGSAGFGTGKGFLSITSAVEPPIEDTNLVGSWKLDEGGGTTAFDSSGHGNHGTLKKKPQWIAGYDGSALNFDGADDYIAIQNLHYANASDLAGVSVSAWIRTRKSIDQTIASFDRRDYWRLSIDSSADGAGRVSWSVNTSAGLVDCRSVTRVDDGQWHHVAAVFDNGRLTVYIDGRSDSSASGGTTFGSENTRYGFIAADSQASSFDDTSTSRTNYFQGDIDSVRIYDKALTQQGIQLAMRGDLTIAWGPEPVNGSTLTIKNAMPLSWSPGDKAAQHDVYFGTDRNAVADADTSTADIYRGRQSGTSYTPSKGVEWDQSHYWRIDEYNSDATISRGSVWSLTVADYLSVDDFEKYNDYPPNEIFKTWTGGSGIPTNGGSAAYESPDFAKGEHFVEITIVHSGKQSMPFSYDNNLKYSEVTAALTSPRDWTEHGVGVLSLWFKGDVLNAAAPMYVAIANSTGPAAVVYYYNPDAPLINTWAEWNIDLKEFADQGVNLSNVDKVSIGFGDKKNLQPGGPGLVFFDDIRLYRPVEP